MVPFRPGPVTVEVNLLPSVLVDVHRYVYKSRMKKRELEEALRKLGWSFLRHGAKPDIWAKGEH